MSLLERLRQAVQAVREYPKVSHDLEETRYKLWDAQQALDSSEQKLKDTEQKLERLNIRVRERSRHVDSAEHKTEAALAALCAFSPKLSTAEEMKRFYAAISPSLDPDGFTLYHAAEKMTGFDLASAFAYEEDHGLFAEADGRYLLHYLTTGHFHAVDWVAVPGTGYKAAILQEVDTSTPEYQAFEKDLYRTALVQMGFGQVLAPGHGKESLQKAEVKKPEEKTTELRLYSPLHGQILEGEYAPPDDLPPRELVSYQKEILLAIAREQSPGEAERGLMAYFYGSDAVNEKVVSIFPSVEVIDGELFGAAICRIKSSLSPGELKELKEYCTAHYADGWGDSFAHHPYGTHDGALFLSFWQREGFFILTKEELERAKHPGHAQPKRGGDAR